MLELAGIIKSFLVVLHLVGLSALLGGFLVQIKALSAKSAEILPFRKLASSYGLAIGGLTFLNVVLAVFW
jgi:hypothetical protein